MHSSTRVWLASPTMHSCDPTALARQVDYGVRDSKGKYSVALFAARTIKKYEEVTFDYFQVCVWCGVVWCGVVWCGVVSCDTTLVTTHVTRH